MIFSELEFHLNSFDSHVTVGGPTGENFLRHLSFNFIVISLLCFEVTTCELLCLMACAM